MSSLALTLYSLLAGSVWGVLAYFLGEKALGPAVWGGVFAGPLIGAAVGRLVHPFFAASRGIRRALWALVSLYVGSVLFGIVVGAAELASRGGGRAPLEVVLEAVLGVLWGVTATGFVVALWPLAYLTHVAIEWRLE